MTLAEEAQRMQSVDGGLRTALALEAQRYLDAVEYFRSQGCEPHWAPEWRPHSSVPCHPRPASGPATDRRRRTSC